MISVHQYEDWDNHENSNRSKRYTKIKARDIFPLCCSGEFGESTHGKNNYVSSLTVTILNVKMVMVSSTRYVSDVKKLFRFINRSMK